MMLILVILYLSPSFINATPASLLDSNSTVTNPLSSTQLPSTYHQRSIWDILWSCLATIFACSWVSVHPNIPPRNEKWWMAPLRRLELMIWAILAPEVIILWAMRQWIGARRLAGHYRDRGWTKTHGHFSQMGGFAMFEVTGTLPKMTEEEIRDRSKGDGLSKALAIGQTLWFIMQCAVRRIEGLYITELELATGAFAVLNGVMYFLWWNKPLDVRCPVPIQLLDTPEAGDQQPNDVTPQTTTIPSTTSFSAMLSGIFYRLAEIGDFRTAYAMPGSTFYASTSPNEDDLAMKWASVAAIIFGGIHCAGWVFIFPSHAETIIWRVCSIAITTIPVFTMAYGYVSPWRGTLPGEIVKTLTVVSIPFYMIARLLLLAEAFATLRGLPPGAYEVVSWVTFIPHI